MSFLAVCHVGRGRSVLQRGRSLPTNGWELISPLEQAAKSDLAGFFIIVTGHILSPGYIFFVSGYIFCDRTHFFLYPDTFFCDRIHSFVTGHNFCDGSQK